MSGGLQLERLQEQMRRLRLGRSIEQLPALLEAAAKRELSYSDFLEELLTSEISGKHERNTSMRVAMAHFPFVKTLESFEFKFQPSIDAKIVRELASCRFIANAENVLLLGPPGVGKTHVAVALGVKACGAGYRTLFVMLLVTVALVVVQEMCARLGAYTGEGLGSLIREQFSIRVTASAPASSSTRPVFS